MTWWIWNHPVVAIGLVVLSIAAAVAGIALATWCVFQMDDGLPVGCTGHIDHCGFLSHDGDTCPIHETEEVH